MRGLERVHVVERQLEPRDHEQAVRPPRARGLALDVREVVVEAHLVDGPAAGARSRRVVCPDHVVGDAEHVESVAPVQVDELGDVERAVAPARVGVQLAEEGPRVLRMPPWWSARALGAWE